MKKSALTLAIALGVTSTSASAFDYFFQTGRSVGYGGAGATYAHWSAAANFNPALVGAAANSEEDFFIVLPNLRGALKMEEGTVDKIDDFQENYELIETFGDIDFIDDSGDVNSEDITQFIADANTVTDSLENLDGVGGQFSVGGGLGIGMAFEKFALSFSVNNQLQLGGTLGVDNNDIELLRTYIDLTQFGLDEINPLYNDARDFENDAADAQAAAEVFLAKAEAAEAQYNDIQTRIDNLDPTSPTYLTELAGLQSDADALLTTEAELRADQAELEAEAADLTARADDLTARANSLEQQLEADFPGVYDAATQSIIVPEDLDSKVRVAAINWAEVATTIGTKFDVNEKVKMSVGASVKFVRLDLIDYTASTESFDSDFDLDDYSTSEDFVTFDLGAIASLDAEERFRVGITVKNLNGVQIKSRGFDGLSFEVEPQARIGASYGGDWFRVAADVDLNEVKGPTRANGDVFFANSQYANIGAVFNAFDFIELRAGYRKNLAAEAIGDVKPSDIISVGAGLFLGPVQADLGIQVSSNLEEEAAIGFQTMITW